MDSSLDGKSKSGHKHPDHHFWQAKRGKSHPSKSDDPRSPISPCFSSLLQHLPISCSTSCYIFPTAPFCNLHHHLILCGIRRYACYNVRTIMAKKATGSLRGTRPLDEELEASEVLEAFYRYGVSTRLLMMLQYALLTWLQCSTPTGAFAGPALTRAAQRRPSTIAETFKPALTANQQANDLRHFAMYNRGQ